MTIEFFITHWNTLAHDIRKMVKAFFQGNISMKHFNSTFITIIPKINAPMEITHYKSISCINILYKAIAKILSRNQLLPQFVTHLLPQLISRNQSTFVKGHIISDNPALAKEQLCRFDQKSTLRRACVVMDLQKAFDTVHWTANKDTMQGMRFAHPFIALIKDGISIRFQY